MFDCLFGVNLSNKNRQCLWIIFLSRNHEKINIFIFRLEEILRLTEITRFYLLESLWTESFSEHTPTLVMFCVSPDSNSDPPYRRILV